MNALTQQPPNGRALVECSILRPEGIRVPDAAWVSKECVARHGDITPYPSATEIGIEFRSPSNTDAEVTFKTRLFREPAVEVCTVAESGGWQVFAAGSEQAASRCGVRLDVPG